MSQPTAAELQVKYEQDFPEELRALLAVLEAARVTQNIDVFLQIYGQVADLIGEPESPIDPAHPQRPAALARYHLERVLAGVPDTEEWQTVLPNGERISAAAAIAIGLLGLQRIFHTYQNSNSPEMPEKQGMELNRRTDQLIKNLDAKNLPQRTIHGVELSWLVEFARDKAKTFQKIDHLPAAAAELFEAIKLIHHQRGSQPMTPGQQTSLAVVYYSLGDVHHNVNERKIGLQLEHDNAQAQFNRERLLTLAFGTLKSALNPRYQATIAIRAGAVAEAGKAWVTSFRRSPKKTLKTSARELGKFIQK